MGLWGTIGKIIINIFTDQFKNWVTNATDEELKQEYESRRQEWARNGYGEKTEVTYQQ